jgi:predicted phage-related endonuclease
MTINEIIKSYLQEKAAETEAKKRAETMKALILEAAHGADYIETELYRVFIKATTSTRLDTKALYKDFPDIKEAYGKTSTSYTVDARERAEAGRIPA